MNLYLSRHARERMEERGATEEEVREVVSHQETQSPGGVGVRLVARRRFVFQRNSPVNGLFYQYKTVEVLFVLEENTAVVVTVKVFYGNEERP